MSSPIHVSLLLLLVVCFNSSTFADSLPSTLNSTTNFEPDSNNEIDINILFLSIVNDLPPPYKEKLFFESNFQRSLYELKPGKPFTTLSNFDIKNCEMTWKPYCVQFNLYDPTIEGGHQRIYWSVREDGIYRSWDNANWDKKVPWGHCFAP